MSEKDDKGVVEVDLDEGKITDAATPAEPAAPAAAAPAAVDIEVDGAEHEEEPAAAPTAATEQGGEDPELIETRRRLEALEERDEQRETEVANERRAAQERQFTTALADIDKRLGDTTERLKALKAAKVKALEEGKTAEQVEIDDQISDLKLERARLESAKHNVSVGYDRFKKSPPPEAQPARRFPKAEAWASRNRWYGDKRFVKETEVASLIDKQLMAEGVDPNSDDYYKRMDDELHSRFKHLAPARKTTGGAPPPNGSEGARTPTGAVRRGRVSLTKGDIETMRTFGMDPSNKEHLMEFARNKVNS